MDTSRRIFKPQPAQGGFTIMEFMVSVTLSLIVTLAMLAMMSNTLGNTSRIVNMTKLTDDMRITMQMLTRDVRRSSYNANAMFCYANEDCGTDGSLSLAPDITIDESGECFTFQLDRDHDGDATTDNAGGFRRVSVNGVGVIEMWIGDESPDCDAADSNWVQMTDPDRMDIEDFGIDDSLSYTEVIFDDGAGTTISQKIRKLRFSMQAQLVADNTITRSIEDIINVRNDVLL